MATLMSDALSFVSTGYCPGCQECANAFGISLQELEEQWSAGLSDEGGFSWSLCVNCGSELGGTRYIAHGRDDNGDLEHFRVCQDCFDAING